MNSKEFKEYQFKQDLNASKIITDYLLEKMKTELSFTYVINLDELFVTKIIEQIVKLGYIVHRPIVGKNRNNITITKKEHNG